MLNLWKNTHLYVLSALLILVLSATSVIADGPKADTEIMVQGPDDLVVLRKEMQVLEDHLKDFFSTTETEFCRTILRMKLFVREAQAQGLDQIPEKRILLELLMIKELSDMYLDTLLDGYELHPHAVESYYLSQSSQFLDEDGELIPLDDQLRSQIRGNLMKRKESELMLQEFERLMEKYEVEIVNPVCHKR